MGFSLNVFRPSNMRIGYPVLRVKDIDRVLGFYEGNLGLQIIRTSNINGDKRPVFYELGSRRESTDTSDPLVILQHDLNAKMALQNSAGLFHFAILVPDRRSLALAYEAIRISGAKFEGFADHLVSESIYLKDPENNGIEIYRDRPRINWPRDDYGQITMDTLPLDLNSLSEELEKDGLSDHEVFPEGAGIGHIHLKVTNLQKSIKFYQEKLGLDLTVNWSSIGAAFLSYGGYHHHIGVNTWSSLNGVAHNSGSTGLEYFTIIVPRRSFDTIKVNIHNTGPEHLKKQDDDMNIAIFDPDRNQVLVKCE
jgi:catechol 2,3-dioxygenase